MQSLIARIQGLSERIEATTAHMEAHQQTMPWYMRSGSVNTHMRTSTGMEIRSIDDAPRHEHFDIMLVTIGRECMRARWVEGCWWTREGYRYCDADLAGWALEKREPRD